MPVGTPYAPLTLGAHRRGGLVTLPDRETAYWLPCATVTGQLDERGRVVSHVWFVTTNLDNHVWCPECRTDRVTRRATRRVLEAAEVF